MLKKLFVWRFPFFDASDTPKLTEFVRANIQTFVVMLAIFAAVTASVYTALNGWTLAYGDSESHINIAKKVVSGLTPGFAQLGGIWLPLTHLAMIPFVFFDPLWRTGLAGAIVSGIFFVIGSLYLYKLAFLLTKNIAAAFVAFLAFALNFNILYLQATPMTEVPLITLFILSSYYFVRYLLRIKPLPSLILAALFAFAASLTRYDGWFLVAFEALAIPLWALLQHKKPIKTNGDVILFSTLAGFGIICWFMWNWLILGDPLYFTNSVYSAKSQQLSWLARGELPAYHNLFLAIAYYLYTSIANIGIISYILATLGGIIFLWDKHIKARFVIFLVLLVPFIFNVVSLFLGQAVIFIPGMTPDTYQWTLFNVRYGVMMVPMTAILFGYYFAKVKQPGKLIIICLLLVQTALQTSSFSPVITLEDGLRGLSANKVPGNVQKVINKEYDGGLVLIDDYARTISITRSTIPMQKIIYVGNKPYWEESLKHPQAHARWIIMQKNDAVWNAVYTQKPVRDELFKYFKKIYTSDTILIFKRID
jgi:hypothetical protein